LKAIHRGIVGILRPPEELTQRCANLSGGSKPSYRERRRASARPAAQGGRFGGSELVLASRRERLLGDQIGDKSRDTRRKLRRREGCLPASLANRVGREFRSPSFSSPVETSFEPDGRESPESLRRAFWH